MSVPMSQYEALLEEVRSLGRKAQHVQQLAAPLISSSSQIPILNASQQTRRNASARDVNSTHPLDFTMESLGLNVHLTKTTNDYEHHLGNNGTEIDNNCSEDECGRVPSTHMSVSSEPISQKNRGMATLYHGTWPVERTTMWNSEPTNLGPVTPTLKNHMDHTSVMSFASSSGGAPLDRVLSSPDNSRRSSQQLEAKMDMVYSLLAMLGGQEHADMGETLLALSTSPESCLAMRQSGCIPLLVQLVQSDKDGETRKKASQALHNLVYAQPDEKLKKRETRVLKLLEQARLYTESLKNNTEYVPDPGTTSEEGDKHPTLTIAHLMKLSFDEGHRQAICQLGGIHVIATLVETEHSIHGSTTEDTQCILMRRYACMALTNLTFGDSGNKALLCSFREFMRALVVHLQSPSDELRQVTASVLRNLSWRADPVSKEILREVGTVTGLMKAAMMDSKENTLKSILSALWNLSAHCTENKAEICAIEGALGFLVDMLSYKTPSKSLAVIENSGGILRNISSQVAVREDYRETLRQHNCLQVLLEQLKSPSLTIVSNACGTLWNLSAKNSQDQETLWQMGAPSMLRSLNHSKHKMIAMGSSAALKNLLSSRPSHTLLPQMDSTAKAMDLPVLPTLGARKQKALLQDLDQNLHETYDNIESPTKTAGEEKFDKYIPTQEYMQKTRKKHVLRSESEECVSHNELGYEIRTSRSDNSGRNELKNDQRLSRKEEHLLRKDSWKEDLKVDVTTSRLLRRDEYHDRDKETSQLCQPFASLNINEPSTSSSSNYQKDYTNKSRLIQNFGSSSLPYNKRSGAYISVRNNYSDCGFEDEIESTDQPIDYSRKYAEIKSDNKLSKEDDKTYSTSKLTSPNDTYGIYAETDLDQPTDYSLRYAEDDSDSDLCDKKNEFIQDTVKTYCTEGTPYETPFIFSTATSMSDLRIDANDKIIDNDKGTTDNIKGEDKNPASDLDEKDHCSVEDISENESRQKSNDKVLKSQFSSGLMSPEKPVNYCDEGTPGYFSRVSSFGSLNSIPANENMKSKEDAKVNETIQCEQEVEHKTDTSPHEGAKAVKFEQTVNYAEETPLMFSRSSSLASLDSVEQHSIHDDRSSVVSDFSRLTSGLVSPSELPDSPSQTVPPSPKPRKGPLEYPSTSRVGSSLFQRTAADGRPQPAPRSIQKPSVFEDNVTKFKEESTPVQFSTTTSLSSLTIDDHDEPSSNVQVKPSPAMSQTSETTTPAMVSGGETIRTQEESTEKQDVDQEKQNTSSDLNDDFVHISDNEDDDDILADCINIGMQNNRHRQNKDSATPSKMPMPTFKYTPKLHPRPSGSGIPLPRTGIPTRTSPAAMSKIPESRLPKPEVLANDSVRTYCTEDTPAILSHAGSNSDLSAISIPNDTTSKKEYLSDDSSNLSGDNDNILAECIQSAMPKPKRPVQKPLTVRQIPTLTKHITSNTPIKPFIRESTASKTDTKLKINKDEYKKSKMPLYVTPKDETEKFSIENSPCQFSLRSSLSDLTVDSSIAELKRTAHQNEASGLTAQQVKSTPILRTSHPPVEQTTNLSRQESLSSLSVESVGSLEAEQALLEQCISSGMPKSKADPNSINEKPIGVATKQYNISKIKYDNTKRFLNDIKPKAEEKTYEQVTSKEKKYVDSKNVYVASVVENTIQMEDKECPETTATIADVVKQEEGSGKDQNLHNQIIGTLVEVDTSQDKFSLIREISLTDLKRNGCENDINITETTDGIEINTQSKINRSLNETNKQEMMLDSLSPPENQLNSPDSVEDLGRIINNRMLDPDAMIESLDRFTAELVSQAASHMQQKEDSKFQASVTECDTWNEDVSPNDVTFPSISGSTPNVITFSDEVNQQPIENQDVVDGPIESDQKSNDFSSLNTSTLTESTLIAIEATKMATTFKFEADMSISGASIELDSVQPPSQLNSLTNSTNDIEYKAKKSPKTVIRKKSLPGLMVRRALSNSLNQASSLESLENHSLSNLDHMNPPSIMGDVDFLDLESSMTSVASLQSEVADIKADFVVNGIVNKDQQQNVNPIFTVKQPVNILHLIGTNSNCTELENINPPSLFNEITDLCNSLADIPTEGIGSELEVFEECATNTEYTLQTENAHFSDANSVTPIQTDVSSNESTPRKGRSLRMLTAKQKRTIAKDRYKTYTVDADFVMKEESHSESTLQFISDDSTADDYKTVDCISETFKTAETSQNVTNKMTPKERRQHNKSRFETQTLDQKTTNALETPTSISSNTGTSSLSPLSDNSNNISPLDSPTQSPAKTKLSIRRNFLQKRLENKDRFKTKTISESSLSPEILSASPTNMNNSTDLHLLLQKEANVILKTLSETKSKTDELLDCETLSLVSNEDDSEHNSGCSINYRTYHKSWGLSGSNNIPVIPSTVTGSTENGLENYENCNLNNDQSIPPDECFVDQHLDDISFDNNYLDQNSDPESENSSDNEAKPIGKPKIVKPGDRTIVNETDTPEEDICKGIRGRRKALYSKSNMNRIIPKSTTKTMKSVIPSGISINSKSNVKSIQSKVTPPSSSRSTPLNKPPLPKSLKPVSKSIPKSAPNSISPKHISPVRSQIKSANPSKLNQEIPKIETGKTKSPILERQKNEIPKTKPNLERQGTFTKEESVSPKTKVPTTINSPSPNSSSIPKPTRIARAIVQPTSIKAKSIPTARPTTNGRVGLVKSASTDRANRTPPNRIINRSPSADARDVTKRSSLQYSASNSNLKSGAVKRASAPEPTQRSSSNSSLTSNSSCKQVPSRIAGLWKKVEEGKKKTKSAEKKTLIQPETSSNASDEDSSTARLIRSNTFENKNSIILQNIDTTKRVSRLSSYVVVDESETRIEYECKTIINRPSGVSY